MPLNCPKNGEGVNLSYLKEIRKYKEIYQLEKAAYVDMFLWAIEILGEEREGILEIFHREIEETARKSIFSDVLKNQILNRPDLEKARYYLEVEEVNTAAKWAACAFEGALRNKCDRLRISMWDEGKSKSLNELNDQLHAHSEKMKERIRTSIMLRNKAAHPVSYAFSFADVEFMIKTAEKLRLRP